MELFIAESRSLILIRKSAEFLCCFTSVRHPRPVYIVQRGNTGRVLKGIQKMEVC